MTEEEIAYQVIAQRERVDQTRDFFWTEHCSVFRGKFLASLKRLHRRNLLPHADAFLSSPY